MKDKKESGMRFRDENRCKEREGGEGREDSPDVGTVHVGI